MLQHDCEGELQTEGTFATRKEAMREANRTLAAHVELAFNESDPDATSV